MMATLRQVLGLVELILASASAFWLLTVPSQGRLAEARAVIAQFATDEAELIQRMARIDAAKSTSAAIPAELLWTGADDASVEIAQQTALVDLANEAGLQILSFGATQGLEKSGYPTKAYEIEVEGGHGEIARLLAGIQKFTPRLAVSYLWMRQVPVTEGQTVAPVNMRLAVWGFRGTGRRDQP